MGEEKPRGRVWKVDRAISCVIRAGGRVEGLAIVRPPHPGIKVWGAIDYLTHFCGYKLMAAEEGGRWRS